MLVAPTFLISFPPPRRKDLSSEGWKCHDETDAENCMREYACLCVCERMHMRERELLQLHPSKFRFHDKRNRKENNNTKTRRQLNLSQTLAAQHRSSENDRGERQAIHVGIHEGRRALSIIWFHFIVLCRECDAREAFALSAPRPKLCPIRLFCSSIKTGK